MKIIIFPGNFLPRLGGLETHVDEFSKYLSRDKFDVTIFAPNSGGTEKEVRHEGVKVVRYPSFEIVENFSVPRVWRPRFYSLLFSLYKEDFDIAMTRTRFFMNSFLGLKFAKCRFSSLPLIHVEHGSSHVEVDSWFTTFVARVWDATIGNGIFTFSDVNVAISQAVHRFVKKYDSGYVPLITRGVDFDKYNVEEDEWVNEEFGDKRVFLYLGRLVKWKGVENSIKAFNELDTSDAVFLVVGDGEDEEKLKEIAGDNVIFTGRVSFERAIKILKAVDVYVHSSYPGGGLSNSLLQAMYTDNLVVASPHEGADEVIDEDTGIPLDDNSVESLKEGMKKALRYEYNQRVKNAKKRIEDDFSWEKKVDEYKELFKKIRS